MKRNNLNLHNNFYLDPDLYRRRVSDMEEARKKLQEKYDKQVEEFKIKQEQVFI